MTLHIRFPSFHNLAAIIACLVPLTGSLCAEEPTPPPLFPEPNDPKPAQKLEWVPSPQVEPPRPLPDRQTALTYLTHADAGKRYLGLSNLHEFLTAQEALPYVTQLLDDPKPGIRTRAVEALGGMRMAGIPLLLKYASLKRDHKEYLLILKLLGETHDPKVVPALAEALKNPVAGIRTAAISAMGETRCDEVVPHLIRTLEDPLPKARGMAADVLGRSRHPDAVAPLIKLLSDPESRMRRQAIRCLGWIHHSNAIPELIELFREDDPSTFQEIMKALGQMKEQDTRPALIKALSHQDVWVGVRAALAIQELGFDTAPAVASLITVLKHADTKARRVAAESLGQFNDLSAVPPLQATLKDPDPAVREAARVALVHLGELTEEPFKKRTP